MYVAWRGMFTSLCVHFCDILILVDFPNVHLFPHLLCAASHPLLIPVYVTTTLSFLLSLIPARFQLDSDYVLF
jgi:hypothetical protein